MATTPGHVRSLLICAVLSFGTTSQLGSAQQSLPTIVLDPGHGWNVGGRIDSGATIGELIEKDINLDVARRTRDYLGRCPINVQLTRDGDAPDFSKQDIDEIVNSHDPTLGISIHANSGTGNPSGTEAWYTVGGYDDRESRRLSALLAESISTRLQIANRGIKPETDNRHGGLYTHTWEAPSALVEIAFLQGDAQLLRERRADFGRALAHAALNYLDMDPHCADWATPEGWAIATYFPGDARTNDIRLRNDSLLSWEPLEYFLTSAGNEYGADVQYLLPGETAVDEVAVWRIPAVAPSRPGVYRQQWQLVHGTSAVGEQITVYMIVVPEGARELKQSIDQRIEELQQRGEQAMQDFVENLEQEALEWAARELTNLDCLRLPLAVGIIAASAVFAGQKLDMRRSR